MKIRRYSELIQIPSFIDRLKYLEMHKAIGIKTFGEDRYINQMLYRSPEWKAVRNQAIIRDSNGDYPLDLAHPECIIYGKVVVHHIIPLTVEMIESRSPYVFNLEYLITCSVDTHEAIHNVNKRILTRDYIPRRPNDTCPWKQ